MMLAIWSTALLSTAMMLSTTAKVAQVSVDDNMPTAEVHDANVVADEKSQLLDRLGISIDVEESVERVVGVLGGSAELPCNLTSSVPGDSVRLVLWFKGDSDRPIYTFDNRVENKRQPKHWSDDKVLQGRAYFTMASGSRSSSGGQAGHLELDQIKIEDGVEYRCRVDYYTAPTTTTTSYLAIIQPPEKPQIYQKLLTDSRASLDNNPGNNAAWGDPVSRLLLGPYRPGDRIQLTCLVLGGQPRPYITWWRDHTLIPADDDVATGEDVLQLNPGRVVSRLTLPALARADLGSLITCQANNNNVSVPVSTSVKLDLTFGPVSVYLKGAEGRLSAGRNHRLECVSVGSRPQPIVKWYLGDKLLDERLSTIQMSADGNTTTSSLHFVPRPQDNGERLTCAAGLPNITNSRMQTSYNLEVNYLPQTQVQLGKSLNGSNIKEGDDLYFECVTDANPEPNRVTWKKDGRRVVQDIKNHIILSGRSLVLQTVDRSASGAYTCHAVNSEGEGDSEPYQLSINHAPLCRSDADNSVVFVGLHETARINCQVAAVPLNDDMSFDWRLLAANNAAAATSDNGRKSDVDSTAGLLDIPRSAFTVVKNGGVSVLDYTPRTDLDYGTLYCSAVNSVGRQRDPCRFEVRPPGSAPAAPVACNIVNASSTALLMECRNRDGSLVAPQAKKDNNNADVGRQGKFEEARESNRPTHLVITVTDRDSYVVLNTTIALSPTDNVDRMTVGSGEGSSLTTTTIVGRQQFYLRRYGKILLTGLKPASVFSVSVYAANQWGRSSSITVQPAQTRERLPPGFEDDLFDYPGLEDLDVVGGSVGVVKPRASLAAESEDDQMTIDRSRMAAEAAGGNQASSAATAGSSSDPAKTGSLKTGTQFVVTPVLAIMIGIGGALLLVSVVVGGIVCCRTGPCLLGGMTNTGGDSGRHNRKAGESGAQLINNRSTGDNDDNERHNTIIRSAGKEGGRKTAGKGGQKGLGSPDLIPAGEHQEQYLQLLDPLTADAAAKSLSASSDESDLPAYHRRGGCETLPLMRSNKGANSPASDLDMLNSIHRNISRLSKESLSGSCQSRDQSLPLASTAGVISGSATLARSHKIGHNVGGGIHHHHHQHPAGYATTGPRHPHHPASHLPHGGYNNGHHHSPMPVSASGGGDAGMQQHHLLMTATSPSIVQQQQQQSQLQQDPSFNSCGPASRMVHSHPHHPQTPHVIASSSSSSSRELDTCSSSLVSSSGGRQSRAGEDDLYEDDGDMSSSSASGAPRAGHKSSMMNRYHDRSKRNGATPAEDENEFLHQPLLTAGRSFAAGGQNVRVGPNDEGRATSMDPRSRCGDQQHLLMLSVATSSAPASSSSSSSSSSRSPSSCNSAASTGVGCASNAMWSKNSTPAAMPPGKTGFFPVPPPARSGSVVMDRESAV